MAATKVTKAARAKKPTAWFIAVRGSYLPNSSAGWLTYLPYIAYLLFSYEVAKHATPSPYVAVLYIVPNWVAATIVMTWVAAHKS